ncbi:hypothetical protein M422DRAFT_196139, partial [Sphaerobolus stellatus SS14]
KKQAKEAFKVQWKKICTDHVLALEIWTMECAKLTEAGIAASQHPKKPARAHKLQLPAEFQGRKAGRDQGVEGSDSVASNSEMDE